MKSQAQAAENIPLVCRRRDDWKAKLLLDPPDNWSRIDRALKIDRVDARIRCDRLLGQIEDNFRARPRTGVVIAERLRVRPDQLDTVMGEVAVEHLVQAFEKARHEDGALR